MDAAQSSLSRYDGKHIPTPRQATAPQAIIDKQIVDDADFVIGIFGYRLGTPTGEAQSGTIEEIERVRKRGKHVALYFSTAPVSREVDREQLRALEQYQQERQKDTLYSIFNTPEELRQLATRHLPSIVSEVYQRLKSSNALSEIESELKKSEGRSEKRLSELANESAQDSRGGGPEIFLHYDLPEEAKKLPGLGIKTKQLIVENTGHIDAYDVQVQDVSVHPERCRATFAIIPRLAALAVVGALIQLAGQLGDQLQHHALGAGRAQVSNALIQALVFLRKSDESQVLKQKVLLSIGEFADDSEFSGFASQLVPDGDKLNAQAKLKEPSPELKAEKNPMPECRPSTAFSYAPSRKR